MSLVQLNTFLEKVRSDTSLQEKLNAAKTPEAAVDVAKAEGFAITIQDIRAMESAMVELTDEQLDGAAGGYQFKPNWYIR